ncbi:hypothetical protein N7472_002603 [Penicillium cf. griseofulvum]|uniref:Uncharacterized protein n=1 Tax=Penicillium cf. griseofulvum TaxID=2972120 RepID=A0A9W9MRL1_9EURO|nr:hypothetical protein N7472_002603 [Penicillium cf. griseofulvum]
MTLPSRQSDFDARFLRRLVATKVTTFYDFDPLQQPVSPLAASPSPASLATDSLATDSLATDSLATDSLATDSLATDSLAPASLTTASSVTAPTLSFPGPPPPREQPHVDYHGKALGEGYSSHIGRCRNGRWISYDSW